MFLKLFGFIAILTCVVQRTLAEDASASQVKYITFKEAASLKRQNEISVDSLSTDNGLESTSDSSIPTDDNQESETTTEPIVTLDNLTEAENNTNEQGSTAEVTTDPIVEEESTTSEAEPSTSTTIVTLPTDTNSSTSESSSIVPSSTEPSFVDPSSTDPSSTEPSPTEPSFTEPSSTEPSSTEPSSTEPSSTEPSSTEPSSTEPSSTEPSSTEPSSTEPSSTEPSSTEPSSPEPETTTVDPKYRNDTFELYLEDFLKTNPSAILYRSPGSPGPYPENLNESFSVTLENCTGIDVVIHYLDLNPLSPDTLNFRGGDENSTTEKGVMLTGHLRKIRRYKIVHTTSLFIWFKTGQHSTTEYRGFVLTYSPFGDNTPPITTEEPPVTIPLTELETLDVQLVLPVIFQTNETYQKFKEILADSAIDYVNDRNISVERAHAENVTMVVQVCPENWPKYETCIRLQFAIALWNLNYDPEADYDLYAFDYELSYNSLSEMWDLYGRDNFLNRLGIEEYTIPDGTYILLLWTGISLAVVVIFIAVLYGIWRIDVFREYRRMYNKSDDHQDILKDKSELDIIGMYPIPHQPYPTLFETNEMTSAGYYDYSNENNSTIHRNSFHHYTHSDMPVTPNSNRHSVNHFSPNITEFNDSQLFPDDEETFGRVPSMSPRSKQKLLVLGAKREESVT